MIEDCRPPTIRFEGRERPTNVIYRRVRIFRQDCVDFRSCPDRRRRRHVRFPSRADILLQRGKCSHGPIVLQKSKVVGLRIFAKNPKQETIADSYNLNRATEVACEFNVPR